MSGGIDHFDGDRAVLPLQLAPVVVEEVASQGHTVGGAQVIAGAVHRRQLSAWEYIVVAVDFGELGSGYVETGLGSVAGGKREIGVPANGDRFGFAPNVAGNDGGIDSIGRKGDGEVEVGLRQPMTSEVAGVDDAGDFLSAGDILHADIVGLGLEDQAVHGVTLGARHLADVVGRQRDGVALPLGRERLAVRRQLAANSIGVGNQERRAEPVAQVAVRIIVLVQHLGRGGQIGRGEHIDIALAGEVGRDLLDLHAAAGKDGDAGELRLGGACGLAGQGDNLLAANFSNSLGAGLRYRHAGDYRQPRKGANENLHLGSIPGSASRILRCGRPVTGTLDGSGKRIPKALPLYDNALPIELKPELSCEVIKAAGTINLLVK